MVIFLIILAIILLLVAALLFLPIPVAVRIVNRDIAVKIFNLPYIKKKNKKEKTDIPAPVKEKKPIKFEDIKLRISAGRRLYKTTKPQLKALLVRLFKVAKVTYYRSVITMGFDDPMNTGMAVGIAGAFLTEMNSFFHGLLLPSRQSYLSAVPNFNEKGLNLVTEVKVQISLFNALLFLKAAMKYKKDNLESINIICGGNVK